jgi:hypothetical protein
MSESDKLLKEISGKMDKVLRLLAVDIVKGIGKEQEKVDLLDSLGFRPIEIAKFLNKTPDNVNVQLNIIRKKKSSRSKATKQSQDSKDKKEDKENTTILSESKGDENK